MAGILLVFIVILIFALTPSRPKKKRPYFDPYNKEPSDLEKMEDDFWGYRGRNLTEEDLKILFGEPKPSTEKRKDQAEKVSYVKPTHEIRLIKSDDSHITIDMFNEMYITEKSSFLRRGKLLYRWYEKKTEVSLFEINNFYVKGRILDGRVVDYEAYESLEQPKEFKSGVKSGDERGQNKEKPYDCPFLEQDDDLPF